MIEENNSFEGMNNTELPVYYTRTSGETVKKGKKKKNRSYFYGVMTGIWISVILFAAGNLIGWFIGNGGGFGGKEIAASSDGKDEVVTTDTTRKMMAIEDVIHQYYLEDTDAAALENGIYSGMIASLDDPYSAYYSAEE